MESMLCRLLISLSLLVTCAAGCSREASDRKPAKPVGSVSNDLARVAFAIVNGVPLTAQDVKTAVEVSARIGKVISGKPTPPFGRWSNIDAMRITPRLVQSRVLGCELDRLGVRETKESDAEMLSRYNRKMRRHCKTKEELFGLLGELSAPFALEFAQESRHEAFFRSLPEMAVTEADVDAYYKTLSNRMVRCEQINRRAKRLIDEAWQKLKAGEAWAEVATNYTEDALLEETYANNWKDWMSLDLQKIEPPELAEAVGKLKAGEFTAPVETEEGLVIVKLLERDGTFCSMARILVRAAVAIEMPDRAAAVKKLTADKRVAWQKKNLPKLRTAFKVEYPLGKKFTYKIWPEPEKTNKVNKVRMK